MAAVAPLKGHVFVFTGEMQIPRDEARDKVVLLGGRVTGALSGKTTHLVAGTDPGVAKTAKARELGIPILDEDGFMKLLVEFQPALNAIIHTNIAECSTDTFTDSEEFREPEKAGDGKKDGANTAMGTPWTEKYRPKTRDALIGNPGPLSQLEAYIRGETQHKAVLLSGQPGVGKTTAAHLLCELNGVEAVEFNASDLRNATRMASEIGETAGSGLLTQEMRVAKRVLIMDEVDGMAGDRGGISALVGLVKTIKTPLICICNDRWHPTMRTLASHCLDLRFRRLDARSIIPRVRSVLAAEGKILNDALLSDIATRCGGDLRYTLNALQSIVGRDTVTAAGVSSHLVSKIASQGMFDATAGIFRCHSAQEKAALYFEDPSFLPLFVHENYPRCCSTLSQLKRSSEAVSRGDLIEARIHGPGTEWSLMPFHAVASCAEATATLILRNTRIDFPGYLGIISKGNAATRSLTAAARRMHGGLRGADLRLYAISPLSGRFVKNLAAGDIHGCTDILIDERLGRDDILALCGLLGEQLADVPSKNKAALTRECKKIGHLLPRSAESRNEEDEDH